MKDPLQLFMDKCGMIYNNIQKVWTHVIWSYDPVYWYKIIDIYVHIKVH